MRANRPLVARSAAPVSHAYHNDVGGPIAQASPLWKTRDYMLLWSGQVVSTLGSTATSIVFQLFILALTNSAAARVALALRVVPHLILTWPVGAQDERWELYKQTVV